MNAEDLSPLPLPTDRHGRATLLAMRRMAVLGLRDSSAAWLMIDGFGPRFLGPLTALRAFLHSMSRTARRPLRIAGCCARYMTSDEAEILAILTDGDRAAAEQLLAGLTQDGMVAKPLAAATRFSAAAA